MKLNPFHHETPVTFVPPGYQPDLDRLPPREAGGCGRYILLALFGLGLIVFIVFGMITITGQGQEEEPMILTLVPMNEGAAATATDLPSETPTIDDWSLTGTAMLFVVASPTLDYCWFLTPTASPSLTPLPVTPDSWGIEGTRIALLTGTPTATPLPTQAPPRAWCDLEISPTATFTPWAIRQEVTEEPTPLPTAIPTSLPVAQPTGLNPIAQNMSQTPLPISNQPLIQRGEQVIVVQTQPPQIIIQTKEIINVVVITATPAPLLTATGTPPPSDIPENTAEATQEPAQTATPLATYTETPTDLPSLTPLAATYTLTPESTFTQTATAVVTP